MATRKPYSMLSEHGIKCAAGRIGVTPDDYRQRRERGENWCPSCESWSTDWGAASVPYCRPCWAEYAREFTGIHYAGPDYSGGR